MSQLITPAIDPLGPVAGLTQDILEMAARRDCDSADIVMALAQVLGIVAAQLHTPSESSLESKLQTFNAAVREVYTRRLSSRGIL